MAAPPGAVQAERVGVLLLNLGGPDTLDDVQPFLYNLFADPDIIRLPPAVQFLQPAIAQAISTLRAPKSREGYEAIGGGSPLRRITEEQAAALREALQRKGFDARTYVAMRYWFPFTGEGPPAAGPGLGMRDSVPACGRSSRQRGCQRGAGGPASLSMGAKKGCHRRRSLGQAGPTVPAAARSQLRPPALAAAPCAAWAALHGG